jgi:hypothetical protein
MNMILALLVSRKTVIAVATVLVDLAIAWGWISDDQEMKQTLIAAITSIAVFHISGIATEDSAEKSRRPI